MQENEFIKIKYSCFYPPVTVEANLSKNNEGDYFLDYNKKNYVNIKGNAEISKIDSKKIDNILNNSKIPIITEGCMGVDGHTLEISLKNLGNEVTYRWWVSPNSDWKPLEELVKLVSKCLSFNI